MQTHHSGRHKPHFNISCCTDERKKWPKTTACHVSALFLSTAEHLRHFAIWEHFIEEVICVNFSTGKMLPPLQRPQNLRICHDALHTMTVPGPHGRMRHSCTKHFDRAPTACLHVAMAFQHQLMKHLTYPRMVCISHNSRSLGLAKQPLYHDC